MDQLYNQAYYENYDTGIGKVRYADSPNIKDFFKGVAQKIGALGPKTVLDYGCAMGHLVTALRDLGVEAYGVDISEYAISQVREDVRPYCSAQTALDPLPDCFPKRFDMVVTIEVAEHIEEQNIQATIHQLCQWSDTVIFSSTPDDFDDPTHVNVRPREYWARLFAQEGYYNDLNTNLDFITSYAICYRKQSDLVKQIESYERNIRLQEARAVQELEQAKKKPFVYSLYWGTEKLSMSEAQKITSSGEKTNGNVHLEAQLPCECAQLRFDPMEAPCVVEDLHIYSNAGALKGIPENGVECSGKLVFLDADPRIRIDTEGKAISSLEIRAHVTPLEYPEHRELFEHFLQEAEKTKSERELFLAKEQQTISSKENKIQELQKSLDHYTLHYHAAIRQREELKAQLAQTQLEYQKIQNAFFWKLTKPARVLMECIKRPLRRVKWLDPVRKVWRYWRTNGLRSTLRRVGEKLSNKQEFEIDFEHLLFTPAELKEQRKHTFDKKYRFSIVVPLYNTPPRFLKEMIQSVINQTYGNWELCMADGSDAEHPEVEKICRKYGKKDSRIRYKKLEKNLGISGNTNACLDMVTGDYIGLFDHDDLLHPAALFEVMRTICETGADFVYTDEATFSGRVTNVITAHFKPNFAPDNLRANNYICHFSVFSRKVLQEAGNFSSKYDGSQDHDFILRATEKAQKVVHIPELLYYWRSHPNSVAEDINSKTYAIDAGKRAVADHIARLGMSATVESSIAFPTIYRIKYALMSCPLISIIIPNKNHFEDITKCVNSILSKSSYSNYEIIIVDNGSTDQAVLDYYRELAETEKRVIVKVWNHPFNFSAMNNYGVGFASGEHIILLNSDTQVIADNWIEEMLMYSQRTDVGAVGAKLYYEDETIQHAGVILGMGAHRTAGHAFYRVSKSNVGYMGRLYYAQNYSAVTAACIMIPKHVWEEIGGLDAMPFCITMSPSPEVWRTPRRKSSASTGRWRCSWTGGETRSRPEIPTTIPI